jgi:hypothetical protein
MIWLNFSSEENIILHYVRKKAHHDYYDDELGMEKQNFLLLV